MKLVYACLVERPGQEESLFGYNVKGTWYPAVFSSYKVFEAIKPTLQKAANEGQFNINFVCFKDRQHLEKIEPTIIRPPSLITKDEGLTEAELSDVSLK